MCLAQGPQRSGAGKARTCGPLISSQALYHRATALPGHSLNMHAELSCWAKGPICEFDVRPRKKIPVFVIQVTRPTLTFYPLP